MAYTISLHHEGGMANRGHNIRQESAIKNQTHIKPPREGIGRDIEIWKDMTEAQAYQKLFGEAQKRYNEKQTRAERKIRSYHAEVEKNSTMHTSYECVVQIGSKDSPVDESIERHILRQFVTTWKQRNPNLFLYGAYFHKDENGGNHLHLDYIPVAHGYTRGLDTQAGLVRALKEMGFEKNGQTTAQTQWQQRERDCLEEICRDFGLDIIHPQKGKKVEHLPTPQYIQQQVSREHERLQELMFEINGLEERKKGLKAQCNRLANQRDTMMDQIRNWDVEQQLEEAKTFIQEQGLSREFEAFMERLRDIENEWEW